MITGEKNKWKISNRWNNIAVDMTIGLRISWYICHFIVYQLNNTLFRLSSTWRLTLLYEHFCWIIIRPRLLRHCRCQTAILLSSVLICLAVSKAQPRQSHCQIPQWTTCQNDTSQRDKQLNFKPKLCISFKILLRSNKICFYFALQSTFKAFKISWYDID